MIAILNTSAPVRSAWLSPAGGRRPTRHKIRPLARGNAGMARTRSFCRHQDVPAWAGWYPAHPWGNSAHAVNRH